MRARACASAASPTRLTRWRSHARLCAKGLTRCPAARLAGPELEIRLLVVHRERLVDARTRLINELRWQLHDLWPEYRVPKRALIGASWQVKVARRLQRAEPTRACPDRHRLDPPRQ